ncbi:MAG: hypothetical protein GC162_13175 [Planctomycetes bacterium]|nr:hypothetical protein [Planctomycetota bacterium]
MSEARWQCDAELLSLVGSAREQTLDAAGWSRLSERLEGDVEAQHYFAQHMFLVADLTRRRATPLRMAAPVVSTPARSAFKWRTGLALAAMVLIVLGVTFALWPREARTPHESNQPRSAVALLSDLSSDVTFGESTTPTALGSDLPPGMLRLASGAAQVAFHGGAVVDLAGPCAFEMTGSGRARLVSGTVSAYVPERARGFTLDTVSLSVIDLGTAFTVRAEDKGPTDVAVTEGQVWLDVRDADPASGLSRIVRAPQVMRLTADRGRMIVAKARPVLVTGRGVSPGADDPQWQIAGVSDASEFTLTAAKALARPDVSYVQIDGTEARWIGITPDDGAARTNTTYTFRTTFDMTGFDTRTACLVGKYAADNTVTAIRLNGKAVANIAASDSEQFRRLSALKIATGLVPGVNVIEFDVFNGSDPHGAANPMGLIVDADIYALPEKSGAAPTEQ